MMNEQEDKNYAGSTVRVEREFDFYFELCTVGHAQTPTPLARRVASLSGAHKSCLCLGENLDDP